MLEGLEKLHGIGYVHNDLKLDNILVGDSKSKQLNKVKLIDFGYSSCYLDSNGHHVKKVLQSQKGNIVFCSKNTLKGVISTRRDDVISLTYILLFLYTGSLKFLGIGPDEHN